MYKYKNNKSLRNNKEQGVSLIIFVLSIGALLAFAALAIDLGVSNNIQNELQKATNSAVMVGALEMEPDAMGVINETQARQNAVNSFQQAISGSSFLSSAVLVDSSGGTSVNDPNFVTTSVSSRSVKLETRVQVPTFFMAVLGIRNLQVNAQSAAINCPAYASLIEPMPSGSITNSDIKNPVGGTNANDFNNVGYILGPPNNVPLALGPGGSITLRMPAPIVNGPGADIYIKELGDLEGYYVYVGIEGTGGAIQWNNISCTGTPTENALASTTAAGAYADANGQYKFYGSGLFDLNLVCSCSGCIPAPLNYQGNINNAIYIRIVDDNSEDGILSADLTRATILPGEHSSTSPGADIDSVAVLHHSRLVNVALTDSDNDNLIDAYENIIGTDPKNADTDGDTINDGDEVAGTLGFITNPRVVDTDGDGTMIRMKFLLEEIR